MKNNLLNWQIDDLSSSKNFIIKSKTSPHLYHHTEVWPIEPNYNHKNIYVIKSKILNGNMLLLWLIEPKPESPPYPRYTQRGVIL